MTTQIYNDYPIDAVLDHMNDLAGRGAQCFVKYTCAGCGSRQMSGEPNTWHPDGYDCAECGTTTKPTGINFLVVWTTDTGD